MITDLRDIKGQESAKRAVEIAITGRHSILLIGPTGCGKSSLVSIASFISSAVSEGEDQEAYTYDDAEFVHGAMISLLDRGEIVVATAITLDELPYRLLDRFHVLIEMRAVSAADLILPPPAENSAEVTKRIADSRARPRPEKLAQPAVELLREAAERMGMTARGYQATVAVAATIAQMDGADWIGRSHVAEAVSYRSLVRMPEGAVP